MRKDIGRALFNHAAAVVLRLDGEIVGVTLKLEKLLESKFFQQPGKIFLRDLFPAGEEGDIEYGSLMPITYDDRTIHAVKLNTRAGAAYFDVVWFKFKEGLILCTFEKSAVALDVDTGVLAKRTFRRRLVDLLVHVVHAPQMVFIFVIDIDDFKNINDTKGHLEGDRVLGGVSAIIEATFRRPTDLVGRIGGDEFAVAAIEDEQFDPSRMAEILKGRAEDYELSVSVGFSFFDIKNMIGLSALNAMIEEVMKQTDKAMYKDKDNKKRA